MDPTRRFTDRVADYVRHRPGYPAAAADAVLDGLGDPRGIVAADIGAGTGIFSRLLADRGVRVIAVEPNEAMRAGAAAHERIEWRSGRAEATGLDDQSVDLVTCAQAFHWFEPEAALAEFSRVLRPRGRVAVIWNVRDSADPLTVGYSEIVKAALGDDPAETRLPGPEVLAPGGWFDNIRAELFRHRQPLTEEGLVGRAQSASYVPRDGPARDAVERGLRALFARCADAAGRVSMAYQTRVYLAERARS